MVSGLALIVPAAFDKALTGAENVTATELAEKVLQISRICSVFLIIAYGIYVWFQMHTHHGIYDSIFAADEHNDEDREDDIYKDKLTMTECVLALAISVALVTLIAISLVDQIEFIVEEHGISDQFMGLILVPLVEKFAEHLTAIDEAWDNTMNLALAHVLGATIQTALFNAPLVVIAGWGLHLDMDLNFDIFTIVIVILSIIVVGNFLKDTKSNYLEGALCVIVYIIIAVAAFYYPNPVGHGGSSAVEETVHKLL
jgi:Ca2+:H+ antiporter